MQSGAPPKRANPYHLVLVWLCLVMISCQSITPSSNPISEAPPSSTQEKSMQVSNPHDPLPTSADEALPSGLELKLSEGQPDAGTNAPLPRPQTARLDDGTTQRVLKRLPDLTPDPNAQVDFNLRPGSLPPPRPGKTLEQPFPPPEAPEVAPEVASGPLKVERFAPEGDVDLAPHLSLTFNQPMVAVTSLETLAQQEPPVVLSPKPTGKWRWIGTRTLLFEPDGRFPMATEYTVEVPAGTRSASGQLLANAFTTRFRTPPPQVFRVHPHDLDMPVSLEPTFFIEFDQQIDPDSVLKALSWGVKGQGAVRQATPDEIKADDVVSVLARDAQPGRWVAIKPASPLPYDSSVQVRMAKGIVSLEGPRVTEKEERYQQQTYGPLKLLSSQCGWNGQCRPTQAWQLEFNNPLDATSLKSGQLTVSPELPGMKTSIYGNVLTVQGQSKGNTTYTVSVPATLRDTFKQNLGKTTSATFKVGSSEAVLLSNVRPLEVLDPYARSGFSVFSINHPKLKVKLYSVTPQDWMAYQITLQQRWNRPRNFKFPGKLIESVVEVKSNPDELVETLIDLNPALKNGRGSVILHVEPLTQPKDEWRRQELITWVQVTQLGITAFDDGEQVIGWITTLKDGIPIEGAQVSLLNTPEKRVSTRSGLVSFPSPNTQSGPMLVTTEDDVAFLPAHYNLWDGQGGWIKNARSDMLSWFVFDDRHLYRPGEKVSFKGYVRQLGMGKGGDISLASGLSSVAYTLRDSQGNEIKQGQAALSTLGAFDLSLDLPSEMNLGDAFLVLSVASGLNGSTHQHSFEVQEFRRPEFEVSATSTPGPLFVGGFATAEVNARYFAGGGLPGASTTWNLQVSSASFTPPNQDDFTFNDWVPWWGRIVNSEDGLNGQGYALSSQTDPTGTHRLRVDFLSVNPPRAMNVRAEATVMDVNRQAWTATTNLLVHPSSLYVGLKNEKYFLKADEPLEVDVIVSDVEGKRVKDRKVSLSAVRLDWVQEEGSWSQKEVDLQRCDVVSLEKSVRCVFKPKNGGQWLIRAYVRDDQNRLNRTQLTRWVMGGKQPPERTLKQEEVTLIPDKKSYQPGDTAQILVLSPFSPAEGVLRIQRQGILSTEVFHIQDGSTTLSIPIREEYLPNLGLEVDLVGKAPRLTPEGTPDPKQPPRPAFAHGALTLDIPPLERTLNVELSPALSALEPGGKTNLHITVKDKSGKGVPGAEVVVVAVDEAVLTLTGHQFPSPLETFYAARDISAQDQHLRNQVLLANPAELDTSALNEGLGMQRGRAMMLMKAAPGGGPVPPPAPMAAAAMAAEGMKEAKLDMVGDASMAAEPMTEGGAGPAIALRSNFDPLALFAPQEKTDGAGMLTVPITLPDNLTRYRLMAIAVEGAVRFGKGESTLTARLPVMVRLSAPRFLNFGDAFELPVVVQNQLDKPLEVAVAVRGSNIVFGQGQGKRVTVPANDRVEVRFAAAPERPGTVQLQAAVSAETYSDAATVSLPVWTPATSEAFATYGQLDGGATAQPIQAPDDAFSQFGGLELTTSTTALQALTDAVLYLVQYPYDCAEQVSSRVLGIAALRDVLSAFKSEEMPTAAELEATMARDLERLKQLQNYDGGFSWWRRGEPTWPYLSVHVAHALARAKAKGYEVPEDMLSRSTTHLQQIERHIPSIYSEEAKRSIRAYALYVLNLLGQPELNKAKALLKEQAIAKTPLESLGWLLPTLLTGGSGSAEVTEILRVLKNRATETASTAAFAENISDGAHVLLHSNRRTDGILLEALIQADPKNELIVKLVTGLLAHRKAGHWLNTQENVFILLAMDRYFNTYEKVTPNLVARVWLGAAFAGAQKFQGRSADRQQLNIPMSWLKDEKQLPKGKGNLILSHEGQGRLYYRIGMRYAPKNLELKPFDAGFTVERHYEAVDNPADVTRDKEGVWHVKAGARVKVKLTMVAPSRRYHVALVDPLPAGLEALNPELKTTGSLPEESSEVGVMGAEGFGGPGRGGKYWWWWRPWYEHTNMRDERVEAFTSLLWEGVHTYVYFARATTPGSYVVPPTRAEEMYMPETFGRSSSERLKVED